MEVKRGNDDEKVTETLTKAGKLEEMETKTTENTYLTTVQVMMKQQ